MTCDSGVVRQAGTLDASAPAGGDGGFVETSAFKVETADSARVSTAAPQGRAGTWLIDPTNYTIAESGGDIKPATLASNLAGGNVVIQTGADGTDAGDIFVNDALGWSSTNSLTLSAHHDIHVNAPIDAPNGRLVLRADSEGQGTSSAGGKVNFGTGGKVNASQTDLYYNPDSYSAPTDFSGSVTGNHTAWMLVNTVERLQAINDNLSGNYALGRDIDVEGAYLLPIGVTKPDMDFVRNPFTGNFDGLNHTIRDMFIDNILMNDEAGRAGMFGDIGSGALVANVTLADSQVVNRCSGGHRGFMGLRGGGRSQQRHDQKRPFRWRRKRERGHWRSCRCELRHDHRFFCGRYRGLKWMDKQSKWHWRSCRCELRHDHRFFRGRCRGRRSRGRRACRREPRQYQQFLRCQHGVRDQ